jgi:GntR family transcriptional regulator, rspAB operon transcriptional repressor
VDSVPPRSSGLIEYARPKPASRSRASDAYALIRARIIECDLEPGRRFTESELAEEHQLGKTPVREALRRLIQEGLVEVIPRQGHRVTPIRLQDVHDIYELRLILESAAAELAIGKIDMRALRDLNDRYMACYQTDPVAALPFNTAFHLASAHACGNVRLERAMAQVLDESARLYVVGFRFRDARGLPQHDHDELIEAFASLDATRVREAVAIQVREAKDLVVDALLHYSGLLEADVIIPRA